MEYDTIHSSFMAEKPAPTMRNPGRLHFSFIVIADIVIIKTVGIVLPNTF